MDIKKFLVLGLASGISSASYAISVVTVASTSIATHSSIHGQSAQKAIETITDPNNMSFLAQHPGILLAAVAVLAFSAFVIPFILVTGPDKKIDDKLKTKTPSNNEYNEDFKISKKPSASEFRDNFFKSNIEQTVKPNI